MTDGSDNNANPIPRADIPTAVNGDGSSTLLEVPLRYEGWSWPTVTWPEMKVEAWAAAIDMKTNRESWERDATLYGRA